MNGMCAVGTYHNLAFDSPASPLHAASACAMQRQLGYIFNHKCVEDDDSSCSTPDAEGFSYMVGCAAPFPPRHIFASGCVPPPARAQSPDADFVYSSTSAFPHRAARQLRVRLECASVCRVPSQSRARSLQVSRRPGAPAEPR